MVYDSIWSCIIVHNVSCSMFLEWSIPYEAWSLIPWDKCLFKRSDDQMIMVVLRGLTSWRVLAGVCSPCELVRRAVALRALVDTAKESEPRNSGAFVESESQLLRKKHRFWRSPTTSAACLPPHVWKPLLAGSRRGCGQPRCLFSWADCRASRSQSVFVSRARFRTPFFLQVRVLK